MKDRQGREYAKLSELKAGDKVLFDDGFDCMDPWSTKVVLARGDGILYVDCTDENGEPQQHTLDGQADNGEDLVGIYKLRASE